eukprot:4024761-Pleurochrysis_carterae.AAC.1
MIALSAPCKLSTRRHVRHLAHSTSLAARMRRGAARVHPASVQLSTLEVCSARGLCTADCDALVAQRRPAASWTYAARCCANLHVIQQHAV